MSNPGPGAQPVVVYVDGDPVSSLNPLPTSGGGGGGTVDQGAANGDATKGWSTRLTDGAAFIVPAKTGQLPAALGATTAAGSVSVGIATDQLSTLATAAKQDTGNASLSNIDGKVATAANQTTANSSLASILGQLDNKTSTLATEATASASKTLLGAGLPAALVGGKLDVNLGTSSITLPVSGPLTDAQLRATPVPVSGTVTVTSTTANQGTGAGAAAPWSVQLSDGAASYTGVKTGQLPTTLGQTTKAASLSVALASDQVGSAGTAASNVLSVQGIASMTPVQVSQATAANLNATVAQGAGSGAAGTFWYTRVTDGTNTLPTMDAAARSGYQRVTDGTNTATVKAASTVPAASDTALVVSLSPNSKNPVGSSFSWFSTATGSTIKSGAGVVRRIIIGSNVAGIVTLYDNTTNSGTVICSVTSTTSTPCNTVELNAAFSTGLHCVTTGSGISVTVVYD